MVLRYAVSGVLRLLAPNVFAFPLACNRCSVFVCPSLLCSLAVIGALASSGYFVSPATFRPAVLSLFSHNRSLFCHLFGFRAVLSLCSSRMRTRHSTAKRRGSTYHTAWMHTMHRFSHNRSLFCCGHFIVLPQSFYLHTRSHPSTQLYKGVRGPGTQLFYLVCCVWYRLLSLAGPFVSCRTRTLAASGCA